MELLDLSQLLLMSTTLLVAFATVGYLAVVLSARQMRTRAHAESKELVGAGGPPMGAAVSETHGAAEPGGVRASKPSGVAWYASIAAILSLVLLTASLVTRAMVTGHAPFASHYEFSVAFAWGILVAHVVVERRYQVRILAMMTLPLALAMLLYASTMSYEPSPLVPALQNSPLLTLHVFTACIGYGAAAVGFGAAVMYLIAPKVRWRAWPKSDLLDEIGYGSVVVTFPMLTFMLILGSIWANVAWGRYWSWDPKETAALVTWLIYGGYLHARVTRDWRGSRSAWLLVLGFAAVIFTYFGNLFFGGLHSY